jgi:hypothetical protein
MIRLTVAALVAALAALPAAADDCRDRIAAMFDGGPLDPFARAPHFLTTTVYDPQGTQVRRMLTAWETPLRSVSGVEGGGFFALIIGSESWTGPTMEGPWSKAPNYLPEDHEGFQRMQKDQMVANLSDTTCPGEVTLDGTTYESVGYVTRTDPTPESSEAWFGSRNTVYIDPGSGRVMRWEQTDFVSSFAPELNPEIHVQVFDYDAAIALPTPE